MKKHFYWFGIMGPIIYLFTVILSGFFIPNYNHINNAVSEITLLCDKKYLIFIIPLFCIYNLCVIIYGFYIYVEYYKLKILNKLQALILIITGFCGLIIYYFSMSPAEDGITFVGSVHISAVCIVFILSMFLTLSTYFTLEKSNKLRMYSLITSIILIVVGPLTGISFLLGMLPGFGLIERTCILSFITWLFVISMKYKKEMK
jgi:hypothetical membrane protein